MLLTLVNMCGPCVIEMVSLCLWCATRSLQGLTLDSPGSCLEEFLSQFSFLRCQEEGCELTSQSAASVGVWLLSTEGGAEQSLENTSRCIVCRK